MKINKNLSKSYTDNINGQPVIVNVYKPKIEKRFSNARIVYSNCPSCASSRKLINGIWECTGDRLLYWKQEFTKFNLMSSIEQVIYIKTISHDSLFFSLYDKWNSCRESNTPEDFNCGYTNIISLPVGSTRTIIPDPLYVLFLQQKLKRPLKEEELNNEVELYMWRKKVYTKYRKGAKIIRIPYIQFPDETEVNV